MIREIGDLYLYSEQNYYTNRGNNMYRIIGVILGMIVFFVLEYLEGRS